MPAYGLLDRTGQLYAEAAVPIAQTPGRGLTDSPSATSSSAGELVEAHLATRFSGSSVDRYSGLQPGVSESSVFTPWGPVPTMCDQC